MGTTREMERPIGGAREGIPRHIAKMGGLSHLLRLDPKKITTADEFNAALDRISDVVLGRKVEVEVPETPEPAQQEIPLDPTDDEPSDTKPKRRKKTGQDRENKGGHDRDAS